MECDSATDVGGRHIITRRAPPSPWIYLSDFGKEFQVAFVRHIRSARVLDHGYPKDGKVSDTSYASSGTWYLSNSFLWGQV